MLIMHIKHQDGSAALQRTNPRMHFLDLFSRALLQLRLNKFQNLPPQIEINLIPTIQLAVLPVLLFSFFLIFIKRILLAKHNRVGNLRALPRGIALLARVADRVVVKGHHIKLLLLLLQKTLDCIVGWLVTMIKRLGQVIFPKKLVRVALDVAFCYHLVCELQVSQRQDPRRGIDFGGLFACLLPIVVIFDHIQGGGVGSRWLQK